MDDILTTRPGTLSKIGPAEIERRRQIVRRADAHNRLEGIYRGPETNEIVDAFVRGDIEVTEMTARLLAQPDPS